MKKLISLFVLSLALQIPGKTQCSFKDLLGKWESTDGMGLEIADSSHIYIYYEKDRKKLSEFSFNFSSNPCWFDFQLKDSSGTLSLTSLFLLVNRDLIQWQVFDDSRPQNFSSSKGQMVFMRRKK